MRAMHEDLMRSITSAAARPTSRRGLLNGGAKLAGGGAVAFAAGASGARLMPTAAQDATPDATPETGVTESPFVDEVDVLNYALTLEHIESAFYRDGLAQFTGQSFLDIGFQEAVLDFLAEIGAHEAAHVETLTQVVTDLGGEPVQEAVYDFGYTDLTGFLQVAGALENTGVDAYTGAAQYLIDNDDLLTAALTIHGVEARHAAYLNLINTTSPFPDAFDAPLTPAEVLEIATPFIVSEDAAATPEA